MKISIIGASGSVGQEIIRMFIMEQFPNNISLELFYHSVQGKSKLLGMIYDSLLVNRDKNISITNQVDSLKGSSIIILCAGQAVATDIGMIQNSGKSNDNNRDSVYTQNRDIILHWAKQISLYAPYALAILVTNPVSRLLLDVLKCYPYLKIIGCGVTNDTMRVRNEVLKRFLFANVNELFIIGEHNLTNQTIALKHFNHYNSLSLSRDVFEFKFDTEDSKEQYISDMKNIQNELLITGSLCLGLYDGLPILYQSYMKHRLSHFLYKTHMSTAMAIKEIVDAYIYEDRAISVEIGVKQYLNYTNCVLGIPIRFISNQIVLLDIKFDEFERKVLLKSVEKYGGLR